VGAQSPPAQASRISDYSAKCLWHLKVWVSCLYKSKNELVAHGLASNNTGSWQVTILSLRSSRRPESFLRGLLQSLERYPGSSNSARILVFLTKSEVDKLTDRQTRKATKEAHKRMICLQCRLLRTMPALLCASRCDENVISSTNSTSARDCTCCRTRFTAAT
jgi:hypothetical protein